MITVGQPQHLGNRTLMLLLSRKTTVGTVLFIISGVLAFIIPSIAVGIAGIASLGGSVSVNNVAAISNILYSLNLVIFLGSIIFILIGLIIALIQYKNHVFILDEFSIKMRQGIFSQVELSIPYRQIQDINLMRSMSHRLFGVSRLIMITAGHEDEKDHEEADTIFDPIDADLADEIRTFLERRIGVQVMESTVQADKEQKVAETSIPQNHA